LSNKNFHHSYTQWRCRCGAFAKELRDHPGCQFFDWVGEDDELRFLTDYLRYYCSRCNRYYAEYDCDARELEGGNLILFEYTMAVGADGDVKTFVDVFY